MPGMSWTRNLLALLATLAVSTAVVVGFAAPANASASGCTLAPNGYVCGKVDGSGLYVRAAHVSRGKQGTDFICDYQGTVRVYNSAGTLIYVKKSGRHQGCTPLRAWFDFSIQRSFPPSSKLCTSFYERGVRQGTTCFRIHR